MTQFMRAHGADPGPTERPRLTGAVSGTIASVAGLVIMWPAGTLAAMAGVLEMEPWMVAGLQTAMFGLGGLVYGWIFSRSAADMRGGWLFGISYGFLIWMLGPVTLIRWLIGEPLAIGIPAQGLFAAHLAWGLVLGLLFPWIDHLLQRRLSDALTISGRGIGH